MTTLILSILSKLFSLDTINEDSLTNEREKKEINQEFQKHIDLLCTEFYAFFEKLPHPVKIKIFKLIDPLSVTNFVIAYPNYHADIRNSMCSIKFKTFLNKGLIKTNDFKFLIEYLGHSINHLNIDSHLIEDNISNDTNSCIFQNLRNLKHLKISNIQNDIVIKSVCDYSNKINTIDIQYDKLTDQHLIHLSNSLTGLQSIKIDTKQIVNDGTNYLIKNAKCLKTFGIKASRLSSELVVYQIIERHHQFLEELCLRSIDSFFRDIYLRDIYKCKKLKSLELFNMHLSKPICEKLDLVDNLESLHIGSYKRGNNAHEDNYNSGLFLKSKESFKLLKLTYFHGFYGAIHDSLVKFCPCVVEIILENMQSRLPCFAFTELILLKRLKNLTFNELSFGHTWIVLRDISIGLYLNSFQVVCNLNINVTADENGFKIFKDVIDQCKSEIEKKLFINYFKHKNNDVSYLIRSY